MSSLLPCNRFDVTGWLLLVTLVGGTGCERVRSWLPGSDNASQAEAERAKVLASAPRLVCADHGQPTLSIPIRDLPRRTKPEQALVREPNEEVTIAFEGVRAEGLLDTVYGSAWRKANGVRVRTDSQQAVVVPVQRFVSQRAWFAWKRADRPDFVIERGRSGAPPQKLGPLYLVWDTSEPQAADLGTAFWIPQVVGLDLTDEAGDEEVLRPATGAPADVASGFEHFRKYCLRCHTLNGRGGLSGPELNSPASVTEYLAPGWLERFIDRPDQVRARTAMPGLPADVPQREAAIAAIVQYLRYMASHREGVAAPAAATAATAQPKP